MRTIDLDSHTSLLMDAIDGMATENKMLKVVEDRHMFIVDFDTEEEAEKGYDILKSIVKRKQYPDNWTVWNNPTLKEYVEKEVNNEVGE